MITDWIIIIVLILIWFQGTRHSRDFSNWIDRVYNRTKQWLKTRLSH